MTAAVGRKEIEEAARRITPVLRPTPVVNCGPLSARSGAEVFLKPEHLQRTGSFKIRGAYNRVSQLPRGGQAPPVVAASAGNHAQGVALASSLCGLRATIFMPASAPLPKVEATRGYGAEVVLGGDTVNECADVALAFAAEHGAVYVPPFDDPDVVAGQGTVGLEIAHEAPATRTVVVPVGGGGLIGGIAVALAHLAPGTEVIGVQASGAAAMRAALDAGAPVALPEVATVADGIAVRRVSDLTLELAEEYVTDVVTVSDEEITSAVLFLLERCKYVVEPAGAVGVAAILAGIVGRSGPTTVVVSGGNVDPLLLGRLIEHGMSAVGRFLTLRVVLPDRPGTLADLTAELATLGLNVLSVDHHRSAGGLPLGDVEVLLTLETRDPAHRDEVVEHLGRTGFRCERLA